MKKHLLLKNLNKVLFFTLGIILIPGCQKQKDVLTFDDVFDISGVESLTQGIDRANDLTGLSDLVDRTDMNTPESISAAKLEYMYKYLEENIQLSSSEKDMLLRNDPDVLNEVISRFGNLPAEFGDKNMDFSDLRSSSLNRYLLAHKSEPGTDYYPEDYYSAVQAYKGYIENCIIKPLKKIHEIVLKDESQLPDGAELKLLVLIVSNNNWDMWWSYWKYGDTIYRIKHKGGSGSFPG